jgi:putative NIF3 family GTP cyclohydrolase 1 type 2
MLCHEVAEVIEDYAPFSLGMAGDELGLLAGDRDAEVKGIVTCWSPTLELLARAVAAGANLVISHEPLLWQVCGRDPEAGLKWYDERHVSAKVPNQKRLKYVFDHGLVCYRYHSNWDWAPKYGMVDMLARLLNLGEQTGGIREAPLYTIPPTPVRDLVAQARAALKLGPSRLVGDPERVVTRVAIGQGGFGQMFTFGEVPADLGAEFVFFGEMLDYTIRYCVELGLSALELGHCQSEHPGMMGMAEFLQERLPGLPVQCLHSGEPWQVV